MWDFLLFLLEKKPSLANAIEQYWPCKGEQEKSEIIEKHGLFF
jgi:hypothetical protein